MASKRQQKRRSKRLAVFRHQRPGGPRRPTPVHAIELKHESQAEALARRDDRFSQLLARLVHDEQQGQYLVTRSGLSEEEHLELASLAEEAHAGFREELTGATQTLRALLGRGDPLYIASLVQAFSLMTGWGTYYEPTQPRGENEMELVAGLLCSQPVAPDLDGPTDAEMKQIHEEIDHILELLFLFNVSMPRGGDLDAAALRFTGSMHWMTMRGSSFANHGEELARELFSRHDEWMLETYGFTVADVIDVGAAVTSVWQRSINALLEDARAFGNGVIERLLSAEGGNDIAEDLRDRLGTDEGKFEVGGAAFMHVFQAGARNAATFSAEEIYDETPRVPDDRVRAVLDELSIAVGSLEPTAYTGLFDQSPLIEQPFLVHDDRYLLAVPGMLVRDTVALLDGRLIRDNPSYSKSRAKTLDRLAVGYLARMLPGAVTHTNLFYDDAELDGLVLFEDIAFIVEGKGSSVSTQAQRGDVRRLVTDIRDAVQTAWEQGARARRFISAPGDTVFFDEHGNELVRIEEGAVHETHIVTPTIHELAGHAPQLARLRARGLFPDQELPWSIFINDLRVIAESSDNAAVFLHYLVWRERLPLGEGVTVHDELDLWASYLLSERFGMLAEHGSVIVGNSTTDFDAYYDGLQGRGPERDTPRKFLEEPVKGFVERMATERPEGWRLASGVCLDLSIPELGVVCLKALDVARAANREGEPVELRFGRGALVGLPKEADFTAGLAQRSSNGDATLIIYVRQVSAKQAEIVWAEYGRPVTFELSDFEKSVLNAPETSAFQFESPPPVARGRPRS
jgi:hypothetical protein